MGQRRWPWAGRRPRSGKGAGRGGTSGRGLGWGARAAAALGNAQAGAYHRQCSLVRVQRWRPFALFVPAAPAWTLSAGTCCCPTGASSSLWCCGYERRRCVRGPMQSRGDTVQARRSTSPAHKKTDKKNGASRNGEKVQCVLSQRLSHKRLSLSLSRTRTQRFARSAAFARSAFARSAFASRAAFVVRRRRLGLRGDSNGR